MKVHFSGIGGTGMVSVARIAMDAGFEVRGSDNPLYPPTSEMVKRLNVPLYEGYSETNLAWNPDEVVVGNALSRGNPEVEEILRRNLPYVSFPEWIKTHILRDRIPIAICGTHGKTTTTTLAAYLLDRCDKNPGFLIGGQPLDFPESSRLGAKGSPFVIEGDEYDSAFFDKRAKFFHYLPQIAVVTSVEFDHGDIYTSLDEITRSFRLMLRQIPSNGWLVLCGDDPGARALAEHAYCKTITYGFEKHNDWRLETKGASAGFQGLLIHRHGRRWAELAVPLAGRHNLLNTAAAVIVASLQGCSSTNIAAALMNFRGIKRRMEVFHRTRGMTFYDDFAHHPTAIRETIRAAHSISSGRVLVALEPRSNTMVTNRMQTELTASLAEADRVWIGPIHRSERIPEASRLDRSRIVGELIKKGIDASSSDSIDEIVQEIMEGGKEGDTVLILSNGSFHNIYDRIREYLDT